jgi:peptidylprolyl isomerase
VRNAGHPGTGYAVAVRIPLSRLFGAIVLLGAVAGGASACASKGGTPPPATAGSGCDIAVSTDVDTKPAVTVPSCAQKPAKLQFTTVVQGTGAPAKPGDSVVVRYYGASFSNHQQFDASWDRGGKSETFTVAPLGQASVIDGWNQGLLGAKVGERRLLVIPPDAGYGAQGAPPDIAPNETLIFVVDIVSITPGS